jgi:NAD(P)-dependent dehydrogenase (short-subunit alcohol dehydrogenase family)
MLVYRQSVNCIAKSASSAHGARVVSLSSRGHQRAGVDFDDPNFERRTYDRWEAYGQSKTATALFAVDLDRRGQASSIRPLRLIPAVFSATSFAIMTDEELNAYGLLRKDGRVSTPVSTRRGRLLPLG